MLLIVILYFSESSSYACRITEKSDISPADVISKLVAESEIIFYGEAVDAKSFKVNFKVIEKIKGLIKDDMVIVPGYLKSELKDEDFNEHKESFFWSSSMVGRTQVGGDCELFPDFGIGKKYLIILGKYNNFKSFEQIRSLEDKWYLKVKDLVSTKK